MLGAFLHSLLSQHHPEEEQAAEAETGTSIAMTVPLARASRRRCGHAVALIHP